MFNRNTILKRSASIFPLGFFFFKAFSDKDRRIEWRYFGLNVCLLWINNYLPWLESWPRFFFWWASMLPSRQEMQTKAIFTQLVLQQNSVLNKFWNLSVGVFLSQETAMHAPQGTKKFNSCRFSTPTCTCIGSVSLQAIIIFFLRDSTLNCSLQGYLQQ